jgi:serine/threonine-protein kinase
MARASALRADEIHPGDLIAGKYRVRTILGRTHGLLVEAFHTEFDQRVIIKILLPSATDEKEIERFRREARTLAKLESEHVARIIDVGNQPDGSFYLVRQFLEGVDLATHLRSAGPQRLQDAVLFVLQAAEAVAETHSHGIILRELQPAHLFLTQRVGGAPLVKIIDFGTAKLMRDSAAPTAGGELTATAMFGLSPYSSPELVRKAKSVDARTDVWSLGAILYELLTARPPFRGETAMLMLQITKEDPVPIQEVRRDLPADIDSVIGWALAKDVDGRFANVHAFAHALTPYAPPEGLVLIDRIGQITHAAKQRKRTGSVPPAARPRPPVHSPNNEDSVTNLRASLRESSPPPARPARTATPAYAVPAPAAVVAQSSPGGLLGPSPQYDAPRPQFKPSLSPPSAVVTGPNAALALGPRQGSSSRRFVLPALGGAAVVLPLLLVLLLWRGRALPIGSTATAESTKTPVIVPPEQQASVVAPAESAAPAVSTIVPIASAVPTVSASAVAVASAPTTTAPNIPTTPRTGGGPLPPPPEKTTTTATPPPPPPPPTGGGSGTLVAVATGGSCAFAVNGASKGTTSTLKIPLKPGSYSVSCKPASGATKSRSVTIKSGETTMAMFKLQ